MGNGWNTANGAAGWKLAKKIKDARCFVVQ
jgi:hypothetical protein